MDCHEPSVLAMTSFVCHNSTLSRDCHRPSAFAMTVCGYCHELQATLAMTSCHTEIATAFSKPRNDKSHNRNNSSIICNDSVWVLPRVASNSRNDKLTITRLTLLLQSLVMTSLYSYKYNNNI